MQKVMKLTLMQQTLLNLKLNLIKNSINCGLNLYQLPLLSRLLLVVLMFYLIVLLFRLFLF